jgi:hypothetical protein
MKPKLLIRIAAFCVLFFTVGHSIGHFKRKSTTDPLQQEVIKKMEEHKFALGPQMRSYDDIFTGMSLNLSIALLAFTLLLWISSNIAGRDAKTGIQILLPILLGLLLFTFTGFKYFFIVPAITCLVASCLIAYSILLLRKQTA